MGFDLAFSVRNFTVGFLLKGQLIGEVVFFGLFCFAAWKLVIKPFINSRKRKAPKDFLSY